VRRSTNWFETTEGQEYIRQQAQQPTRPGLQQQVPQEWQLLVQPQHTGGRICGCGD
jgi:hypothetical protein